MAPRRKAAAAFAIDDSDEVCCLDDMPEQPQQKKRKPRAKGGKVQAEKRTGQDVSSQNQWAACAGPVKDIYSSECSL